MNYENYSNHLLKNVCLYYFWEPFPHKEKQHAESLIGITLFLIRQTIRSAYQFKNILRFKIPTINKPIALNYQRDKHKNIFSGVLRELNNNASYTPDNNLNENEQLKSTIIGFLALRYTLLYFWWFFSLKGFDRLAYRKYFWHCFYGLGMYRYIFIQLKKSLPHVKVFLSSNDHIGEGRAGLVAASRLGIKTAYLQHASVTENFPPLEVDLALLDGIDSKNKYQVLDTKRTQIALVGSPKYDTMLARKDLNFEQIRSDTIGICVNLNEEEYESLINICKWLSSNSKPFLVRFHPRLKESAKLPFRNLKCRISDPSIQSELDFIIQCCTIVSGDSSILLDTLVLFRKPIYFTTSDRFNDYYGFVKNGIVMKRIQHINDLKKELSNINSVNPNYREKAQKYIATLGTRNEGMSAKLIADHITNLIQSRSYSDI